jgi:glycosyltransferase involved in cell wall biosynthesis
MLCFYPLLQRKILKRFSHVVVQADFLAETLRTRHPNIDCNYITLTSDCVFDWHPETVNTEHLATLKALKERDKYVVGVIAQVFYRAKGFDVFLDAMTYLRDLPQIHAVIIGYGDEVDLISKNIKRLDLGDRVTFLGQSPAAHHLMSLIEVIVSPTHFFDAFPTVILEAMEANCCIVGSDINAHRVQLKYDDLMFPNGDARALAKRLVDLYKNEKSRYLNNFLVNERRKEFEFDWDAKIVEIFESRMLS